MDLGLRREAQISEESNTMYTLKTNKSETKGGEDKTVILSRGRERGVKYARWGARVERRESMWERGRESEREVEEEREEGEWS